MGNGLKFTDDGSVVTHIRLMEKTGERARLRFEVVDTGVGIAPDKIALLFKPFQQVDSSPERRYGGTGLGLAISGRLVELMGGRMGVESAPGSGSTFWFELEMPALPDTVPSSLDPSAAGLRVLIARNHALSQRLSVLSLEKLGFTANSVASGAEVLNCLESEPYDAVLFDQRLADMDGLGLATAIRESERSGKRYGRPRLRLIALISGNSASDRALMLANGIDATLADVTSLASLKQALLGPAPSA
jgi:CheY-like chemotaxis protein